MHRHRYAGQSLLHRAAPVVRVAVVGVIALAVLLVTVMAAPGAAGPGVADLQLTTTAEPGEAEPGEPITWTVRITNLGPDDATGVELVDVVGPGLQITGVPSICAIDAEGASAACDVGDVAAGETTLLMIVTDTEAGPEVYENEATVSAETDDPVSDNDVSRMMVSSGAPTETPEPTPEPTPDPTPEPTETVEPTELPATGRYSLPMTLTGGRLLALGIVLAILGHRRRQIAAVVGWTHRRPARRRKLRWW